MTEYAVLEAFVTPRQRFAAGQTVAAAEVEPGPALDHYVPLGLVEVAPEEAPAAPDETPASTDSDPDEPVEEN